MCKLEMMVMLLIMTVTLMYNNNNNNFGCAFLLTDQYDITLGTPQNITFSMYVMNSRGYTFSVVDEEGRFVLLICEKDGNYHLRARSGNNYINTIVGLLKCDNIKMRLTYHINMTKKGVSLQFNNMATKLYRYWQQPDYDEFFPNKTLITMGNLKYDLDNYRHMKNDVQGCLIRLQVNKMVIELTRAGDSHFKICPAVCTENYCNGGICHENKNYFYFPICDCTNAPKKRGPTCNQTLEDYVQYTQYKFLNETGSLVLHYIRNRDIAHCLFGIQTVTDNNFIDVTQQMYGIEFNAIDNAAAEFTEQDYDINRNYTTDDRELTIKFNLTNPNLLIIEFWYNNDILERVLNSSVPFQGVYTGYKDTSPTNCTLFEGTINSEFNESSILKVEWVTKRKNNRKKIWTFSLARNVSIGVIAVLVILLAILVIILPRRFRPYGPYDNMELNDYLRSQGYKWRNNSGDYDEIYEDYYSKP